MASPPPPGVYVPTFFVPKSAENYNSYAAPLDLQTQAKHAVYLAKCGIVGQVVLGSTGEAIAISNAERMALLKHYRAALDAAGFPDYPIVAGTATQEIGATVELLRDAKEAGCQWGMVLAPGYFAPVVSQEGIIEWYEAVARQSPIPILIYHYPGVSNNLTITPQTFATLALHPNIVGCKLSHGDVSTHLQIACNPSIPRSKFATFTGMGQHLLPVLSVNCAGTIDGLAGIFPRTIVHLYNRYFAEGGITPKNAEELQRLQFYWSRGEEVVAKYGTVGIKEAISRVLGFGEKDGTRAPMKGGFPGDGDKVWEGYGEVLKPIVEIEGRLEKEAERDAKN
ncbi:MAG: hypothetical protein M1834_002501 [Cirrosporium novae-zelandiae]|nr:MAG: hypothetical protein M1834_002501 [Cirrosporium novae-zelandiae]